MSTETKTLLFNAVPLFAIAAAYGAVSFVLVPTVWRSRSRATAGDLTVATIFPAVAIVSAIYGIVVADNQTPIADELWLSFAAMIVGLVPAFVFLIRWAKAGLVSGGARVREAEERTTELDRELTAVTDSRRRSSARSRSRESDWTVIDESAKVLGVEFGSFVLVSEDLGEATGVIARRDGADVPWDDVRIDLRNESSGTARAVFDAAPFAVYDAPASPLVQRQLIERAGVKSIAYVPLLAEGRVLAVVTLGCVSGHRAFSPDELRLLQSLANETALALDRLRSSAALAKALERERLIARIAGRFRTQLDLDTVLRVAVEETARALGAQRAFVRIGKLGTTMPIAAEWVAPGLERLDPGSAPLPGAAIALREGRSLVVDDIETDAVIESIPGGQDRLRSLGSRSVLATPIVVFDEGSASLRCIARRRVTGRTRTSRSSKRSRAKPGRGARRASAARARGAGAPAEEPFRRGAERHLGAPVRDRRPAARRRARGLAWPRRGGRLPVRRAQGCPALRRGARPARRPRRLRVPGRERRRRGGRAQRNAGDLERRETIPHDAYGEFRNALSRADRRPRQDARRARRSPRGEREFGERDIDVIAAFRRSRRSHCATPRRTRSGRARHACSVGSPASRPCSASRCR